MLPGSGYAGLILAKRSDRARKGDGCHNRTRTYDPLINSQLLYQLSYVATKESDYTYRQFGLQGTAWSSPFRASDLIVAGAFSGDEGPAWFEVELPALAFQSVALLR